MMQHSKTDRNDTKIETEKDSRVNTFIGREVKDLFRHFR